MAKIFDYAEFAELLMNDTSSIKLLLEEYKTQTEKHLKILAENIMLVDTDKDTQYLREQIKKNAHLIKGSSFNVTAENLGGIMLELEKEAFNQSKHELLSLLEKAEKDFTALCAEIEKAC